MLSCIWNQRKNITGDEFWYCFVIVQNVIFVYNKKLNYNTMKSFIPASELSLVKSKEVMNSLSFKVFNTLYKIFVLRTLAGNFNVVVKNETKDIIVHREMNVSRKNTNKKVF